MRVRLIRPPSRRARSERGAIAVLTVALTFVMMLTSAFAVDLGMAYTSKRQLQTAADSAVLAAAAVYAKYPGTCADLVANATYRAQAQAAADGYRTENRSGSAGTPIAPACNSQGELEVGYAATGTTATTFASLVGIDSISDPRSAKALVDVPTSIGYGIRPYALCSADLPLGPAPSTVVEVKPPGQAHSGSSCASRAEPRQLVVQRLRHPGRRDQPGQSLGHGQRHRQRLHQHGPHRHPAGQDDAEPRSARP